MYYSFTIALLLNIAYYVAAQNTPVIGGACKQGTADVQIGGKQTQFFLKCEINDDSESSNGIWVVKSRAQAMNPSSNDAQQHPKKLHKMQMTNVCEQDSTAREGQYCSTSETCLQQNYEYSGSYLQCDSTQQRWNKRNCQQDFAFNFEQQSCIAHTKTIRHVARQASNGGVVCTYSSCNNNNPCNIGTCNNGYCCSSAPIAPLAVSGRNCLSCNNNNSPRIIAIPTCQGGRVSSGSCVNGRCGFGYTCTQNQCCPSQTTVCADGTQAAGACVNGQCGTGFTCSNNLCCSSNSSTPRCLDGTSAVGACINGRCGSGYACTTGNICCPSTTSVCPIGQVSIGRCVNNQCPSGYTCTGTYPNNYCCSSETSSSITCDVSESGGPCIQDTCFDGYSCDTVNQICCPAVSDVSIGPCLGDVCPEKYICVKKVCYERLDSAICSGSVGLCLNGLCQPGYTCINGNCCP